jgi:uncharacterized protein (TIGR04255 family)
MFEPTDQGHKHAIREAVFAIALAHPFAPDQIQRFIEFGNTIAELPSKQFLQQFAPLPMAVPPGAFSGIGGSAVQAFKPDGTLSWRLILLQNTITVNCLDYESWEIVWPRARDYLSRSLDLFSNDPVHVSSLHLQYINAFHWRGSDEITPDLTTLLNTQSDKIPTSFWKRSSREWHLQKGWFEKVDDPQGKILFREHLSGQIEQNIGLTVMVDLSVRNDLLAPVPTTEFPVARLNEIFGANRRRIRASLRNYVNEKVCTEIGAVPL